MVEMLPNTEKVEGRVVEHFLHEDDHNYGVDLIQESVRE